MKLVLLQPPIQDFYATDIRLQPLGLCSLKAALRAKLPAVDVVVKDFHQGHGRRTVALPAALANVAPFFAVPDRGPFSTFHHYYHFGATFAAIAADVAAEKPDLVGISCLFTPYYREALDCARAVKERCGAPIIMGGSHVAAAPESVLADPAVDYIIRGEGERPLVELLTALAAGSDLASVPNLGFKRDGAMVFTELAPNYELETLPPPDFSDLDPGRYRYEGKPLAFVATSRGCPHDCAFCSVRATFGPRYRRRPTAHILAELDQRHAQGFRVIDFEDDNLTADRSAFHELLEGLAARFPPGSFQYLAMNGVSYHGLDGQTLAAMRAVGFTHLNLSLVSANQSSLRRAARPHDVVGFERVATAAFGLGFRVVAYQIVGLPYETVADMVATMALLARLPVLAGASVFYLTPGAGLARGREMSASEMVRARSTALAVQPGSCFEREDLYSLFIVARIVNFLKGIPTAGRQLDLAAALDIARSGHGRAALGAEILARLLAEKKLYAAVRGGFKPLERFRPALLFEVLQQARSVGALDGGAISVGV